jgi:rod shape-determining protein MreC
MRVTKKNITIGALAAALLSPFFFLSSPLKPWATDGLPALVLQEVTYPIQFAWHYVTGSIANTWHRFADLTDAASENQELRREVAQLRTRTIDYEEQALELARLRKLLGFSQKYERKLTVAEVVGSAQALPFDGLRISQGSSDELMVGMPVLTPAGVVGRVIRTGMQFSDIQLLTDPNFNLDVLLQRTRVRGVLQGKSNGRCQLNLSRRADIRIGDTVITSGIVGGFPKGLPVGRVIRISYDSDDVSQAVTVEPWVDYRRVEEIFVIKQRDQELEKIIETAGNEWIRNAVAKPQGG